MKLKIMATTIVAGVWLVALCPGAVHGGWFGFGDSSTSSDSGTASKPHKASSPRPTIGTAKPAPSSGKSTSGGIAGLFGLGSQSSAKQPPKRISNPYKSKAKKDKKESSWWNSWFKPKEPPPPKSTSEWMKLKQVKW